VGRDRTGSEAVAEGVHCVEDGVAPRPAPPEVHGWSSLEVSAAIRSVAMYLQKIGIFGVLVAATCSCAVNRIDRIGAQQMARSAAEKLLLSEFPRGAKKIESVTVLQTDTSGWYINIVAGRCTLIYFVSRSGAIENAGATRACFNWRPH